MQIKEDITVLASFGKPYKFGDFTVTWASYLKTMEPRSVISPAWRPSGVRNVSIKK